MYKHRQVLLETLELILSDWYDSLEAGSKDEGIQKRLESIKALEKLIEQMKKEVE